MTKFTSSDALGAIESKNHVQLETIVGGLLNDRLKDALATRRNEVAQSYFNASESVDEESEQVDENERYLDFRVLGAHHRFRKVEDKGDHVVLSHANGHTLKVTKGQDSTASHYAPGSDKPCCVSKSGNEMHAHLKPLGLREAAGMDEITEELTAQIDEISKELAANYVKHASVSQSSHAAAWGLNVATGDHGKAKKQKELMNKRASGLFKATDKLTGKARVSATEEVQVPMADVEKSAIDKKLDKEGKDGHSEGEGTDKTADKKLQKNLDKKFTKELGEGQVNEAAEDWHYHHMGFMDGREGDIVSVKQGSKSPLHGNLNRLKKTKDSESGYSNKAGVVHGPTGKKHSVYYRDDQLRVRAIGHNDHELTNSLKAHLEA